jgi:hypothetical protein
MTIEGNLVSFVLRFVHDEPGLPLPTESPLPAESGEGELEPMSGAANWHGIIRHVQSNSERHFTHWTDALSFIQQYVDLAALGAEVSPTPTDTGEAV